MHETRSLYEAIAREFDRDRRKDLMERPWLEAVRSRLGAGRSVLDLGCGSAEPIARFFIDAGC